MTQSARARAYLAKLPPAIAGQGGQTATFAASCRLVEFGICENEAFEILCDWNRTHCQPPWGERDLRHKLADAFRRTSPRRTFCGEDKARGQARRTYAPPAIQCAPRRPLLPPMNSGMLEDISALARLRGLSPAGIAFASARGLVGFGLFRGKVAWFIKDKSGRVAQARRMDGQPWADGVKAWTISGSQAKWPVGIQETDNCEDIRTPGRTNNPRSTFPQRHPVIVLCEGGADLLAACHFIVTEKRTADCAPVAMLGAGCSIHPDALPLFSGKRVRVFPHLDETGQDAANRWAAQLADVGTKVDAFSFSGLHRADGLPVKDFNDLAAIHADDYEAHHCLWNLFP